MFDSTLDRSDRKISAHATLQTPPRPAVATAAAAGAKGRSSPSRAAAPPPPTTVTPQARTPSPRLGEQEVKRRNKGKAPAPPGGGGGGGARPSSMVDSRSESATPPPPQETRPKSAYVSAEDRQQRLDSPGRVKKRVSSPQRSLKPSTAAEGAPSLDSADDERRSPSPGQRMSPEKDLALRTLDDVIQEAEETMGKYK